MKEQIIYKNPDELIPYANNAKIHHEEQVTQIAASIKEFGFNNPILLDGENGVIAGHGRLLAAKKLGLDSVPCIELTHMSEAQKKAYILADNRLGEVNTEWNMELVNLELEGLQELDFDISLTGFELDIWSTRGGHIDGDDISFSDKDDTEKSGFQELDTSEKKGDILNGVQADGIVNYLDSEVRRMALIYKVEDYDRIVQHLRDNNIEDVSSYIYNLMFISDA